MARGLSTPLRGRGSKRRAQYARRKPSAVDREVIDHRSWTTSRKDYEARTAPADGALRWISRRGGERCLERDNLQDGSPVTKQYFAQGFISDGKGYYTVTDPLGSVRQVLDAEGKVQAEYDYTPWGYRFQKTGNSSVTSDIGFAGYFHHAASGYDFALYRAYDSTHRRWLNRDPIGEAGGMNLYAYVNGNPTSYVDPYGLWVWSDPAPQWLVDYSAGLGDAASLGLTSLIRDAMGTDDQVDKCSTVYQAGGWSAFALGAGRIAYASLAKAGSELAASGAAASAFRSGLRKAFGGGNSFRPPNLSKYTTDDALRAAAGRTNLLGNAWGAGAAVAGAYEGSGGAHSHAK